MSPPSVREKGFIGFLEGLVADQNRAALAALRRGLGKRPGEAAEMYPYVVRWLPAEAGRWREEAHYLVAALLAYHQVSWPTAEGDRGLTNLGASFGRLAAAVVSDSVEKRFVALLSCDREDLPEHLRHGVALLKSKEVPVDWAQLLRDVQDWDREDRAVQRGWARAFWRQPD